MNYNSRLAHGLMFHRFSNSKKNNYIPGTLIKKDLEDIIKYVGRNRILTPQEWLDRLAKNKLSKDNLCITFDDGLKSQYNIALPVLNKYKIKAFWFIPTGSFSKIYDKNEIFTYLIFTKFKKFQIFFKKFLNYTKIDKSLLQSKKFKSFFKKYSKKYKYYSESEIQYRFIKFFMFKKKKFETIMTKFFLNNKINIKKYEQNTWMKKNDIINLSKNSHIIGMHSFSHPYRMSDISKFDQKKEYKKNYKDLKLICKKNILSMSHPMNSYNNYTLKLLNKMGVICGFKADSKFNTKSKKFYEHLEIPREDASFILKKIKKRFSERPR